MPGTLYLVATPIGNLEDITLRALRILKEVNLIAAEDTRQTRKLLSHYKIETPLTSHHDHSAEPSIAALLERLADGDSIALVTDAGTPGISDPGYELTKRAIEQDTTIVPIPGASAPINALIASGLPNARFLFEGFLPRTRSTRTERLKAMSREIRTIIFFESPQRLVETLTELAKEFGETRRVSVAREITKLFEEHRRGILSDVIAHFKATPPRGECVIVVEGGGGGAGDGASSAMPLPDGAEDANWKELIKLLAKQTGIDKRDLYQAIVNLKNS
jgi:16S rRNA (cytidine1402-2'-O)-methyltransferase